MSADQPDGNTAALRQHEASEDRAQSKYEAYGERARESIVDDLMNGFKVGRTVLYNILEDHNDLLVHDEIVSIAINKEGWRDSILSRLEKRCEKLCRDWLDTVAGQDAVTDLVNEMDEDARGGV